MNEKRFVVTGTGRSGTTYIARLFARLGVPCTHEEIFRPRPNRPLFDRLAGEASWLAVPWIDRVPEGSVVLHQTRHPVEVGRSFLGIQFFADVPRPRYQAYRQFLERASVRLDDTDPTSRFVSHWVEWNLQVESRCRARPDLTYHRYSVEGLDVAAVRRLTELIGRPKTTAEIASALASADRFENQGDRDESFVPERIPPSLREEMARLATEYGYALERPVRRGSRHEERSELA